MWIKKLKLNNFRNYENTEIDFDKNINVFYGENAQGKTNIVEAIFFGSIGRSFRTNKDRELINFNKTNCNLELFFEKSDRDGKISINLENKKNIFINGIKAKNLSQLIGNINVVIFTPDDINILKGGPQNRRRFLDIMISQLKPNYVHIYNLYLKVLEERNYFLKNIQNQNIDLLEIYDEKLAEYGSKIYEYRKEFVEKLKNKIQIIHKNITKNNEEIDLKYISDCFDKNVFLKLLEKRKEVDIAKGYTTKGIHRDDLNIFINDLLVNVYGSQGQHRTAILSLKLAELQVIYDEIGENPILLLDDFMSELDKNRKKNFFNNISDNQVIITCTDREEFDDLNFKFFNVKNGKIK